MMEDWASEWERLASKCKAFQTRSLAFSTNIEGVHVGSDPGLRLPWRQKIAFRWTKILAFFHNTK